jgi:hypothetical protein
MRWHPIIKSNGKVSHLQSGSPLVLEGAAVVSLRTDSNSKYPTKCEKWKMSIDTGSPVSLIPRTAAAFLGLKVGSSQIQLTLADQKTLFDCFCVFVQIWHEDFGFVGSLKVGVVERGDILLGRDALDVLLMIYDGKRSRFGLRKRRKIDYVALALMNKLHFL